MEDLTCCVAVLCWTVWNVRFRTFFFFRNHFSWCDSTGVQLDTLGIFFWFCTAKMAEICIKKIFFSSVLSLRFVGGDDKLTISLTWFFCGSCCMAPSSIKRGAWASVFVPAEGLNRRLPLYTAKKKKSSHVDVVFLKMPLRYVVFSRQQHSFGWQVVTVTRQSQGYTRPSVPTTTSSDSNNETLSSCCFSVTMTQWWFIDFLFVGRSVSAWT